MKYDDLVDIESLAARLQKEGASAFLHWKETALDVCGDQYKDICRVYHDYSTLSPTELLHFRYVSFIQAMLDVIPTLELKKSFLNIEALQEKKFVV
jgi:hypothetical protein